MTVGIHRQIAARVAPTLLSHYMIDLEAAVHARKRLVYWARNIALPRWADQGTDWRRGGFFEKIDARTGPVEEPRRTRVVARQIYVYATAERLGWHESAAFVVEHGLRFLLGRLRQTDGTFARAISIDGLGVDRRFELYEHAFVLFALAAAYQADPGRSYLLQIGLNTLEALREGWSHKTAGFEESRPPSVPLKSNPHMHLFEAALSWAEVAPVEVSECWKQLADELGDLCLKYFIDVPSGALREYFASDWSFMPGAAGSVIEPGHQFEWAWLLMRWAYLNNRFEALEVAHKLIQVGEVAGVDANRDVAVNELDANLQVVDGMAKIWPQTERLKAWSTAARMAGDPVASALAWNHAARAAVRLESFFQPSLSGLWAEHMCLDGRLDDGPTRASSLYHIVCAIATLDADLCAVSDKS